MNNLEKLNQLRQESKLQRTKDFNDLSKSRLKKIARKKLTSSFIGALADFEEIFGKELWGHGLKDSELTDEQKNNKLKWQQIRIKVLNRGNHQIRNFDSELDLYETKFLGNRIIFTGESNGQN
jgi:hypothetical protein